MTVRRISLSSVKYYRLTVNRLFLDIFRRPSCDYSWIILNCLSRNSLVSREWRWVSRKWRWVSREWRQSLTWVTVSLTWVSRISSQLMSRADNHQFWFILFSLKSFEWLNYCPCPCLNIVWVWVPGFESSFDWMWPGPEFESRRELVSEKQWLNIAMRWRHLIVSVSVCLNAFKQFSRYNGSNLGGRLKARWDRSGMDWNVLDSPKELAIKG